MSTTPQPPTSPANPPQPIQPPLLADTTAPSLPGLPPTDPISRAASAWVLFQRLGVPSGVMLALIVGALLGSQGYLTWLGITPRGEGGALVLASEDRKRLDDLTVRVGRLEEQQAHEAQAQKIRDEAQAEVLTLREQQRQKDEAAAADRLTKIEDKLDKLTEAVNQRRR